MDPHYRLINKFYGDRRARRSGLLYMNHIDEGLVILDAIKASTSAKQAFCLHPIIQNDTDLVQAKPEDLQGAEPWSVMLATEYRNVANQYLSIHRIASTLEITGSSLPEVMDMLIADKIQNRKDFLLNRHLYNNAVELDVYFRNWLIRLNIDEEEYTAFAKMITK